jgi:hypothetical protein
MPNPQTTKYPNGCHQTGRWSEALEQFVQNATCNDCGAQMVQDDHAEG